MALYNCNGLVAPRLSLYNFWFQFTRLFVCSAWVPCSSIAHHAPGKKAAVLICKVVVRPGRDKWRCSSNTVFPHALYKHWKAQKRRVKAGGNDDKKSSYTRLSITISIFSPAHVNKASPPNIVVESPNGLGCRRSGFEQPSGAQMSPLGGNWESLLFLSFFCVVTSLTSLHRSVVINLGAVCLF